MIIFWVILSVWLTGSLAIGIWASVRLHRDEYWMAHGDEGWTKFDCAKGFVEHFHTWPGETLVAVLSAVFWPVALLVGALAYLAVGLVWHLPNRLLLLDALLLRPKPSLSPISKRCRK